MRKAETTSVLAYRAMVYGRAWRGALTPQLDSAMPLPPLIGHERIKTRLAGAPPSRKIPPTPLRSRPPGGGKQRLGPGARPTLPFGGPAAPPEAGGCCPPPRVPLSLRAAAVAPVC